MANKVEVEITGKNDSAIRSIKDVNSALGSMESMSRGPAGALSGLANMMSTKLYFAAGAAVAGFGILIKSAIDTADELNDMSKRTGMSVESLSTLRYAAKLSGTSLENLQIGFKNLSQNIDEGKLKFKTTEEALMSLADKFSKMPDGPIKTAEAVKYFGRSGQDLIPLLNEGSEGIAKMQSEARRLGLELSTNTAEAADKFNDSVERMNMRLEGLAFKILPTVLEALNVTMFTLENFGEILGEIARGGVISIETWANVSAQYAIQQVQIENEIKKRSELNRKIEESNRKREEEENKIKKLREEWSKLNEDIGREIRRLSMSDMSKTLDDILYKADQWRKKFGDRKIIDDWVTAMMEAKLKLEELDIRPKESKEIFGTDPTQNLLIRQAKAQEMQMEMIQNFTEFQKEKITEVTALEAMNWALRQDTAQSALSAMSDNISGLLEIQSQKSKTGFALFKAYQIAETSIATYDAAVKAYSALAGIPIIGPVLAVAAASAAIAFGVAKVSQIAAMQPGGRASAGGSASAPRLPSAPSATTPAKGGEQIVTINIYGSIVDQDGFAREIIPAIRKAVKDGV